MAQCWIHALSAAAAALLAGCAVAPTAVPSEQTVAAHVARATGLAGNDLKALLRLCNPPAARQRSPDETDRYIASEIARLPPPPAQAFDNLYFVGGAWSSAWALRTSEGIIVIDALNNAVEAAALIDGGLRKLGLDPAQIRYVVVTHGHGDHYGGARYLAEKYIEAYIDSARRMGALAQAESIDVMLSNHPSFDGTVAKFAAMAASAASGHPFVIGQDAVVRTLGVMQACARAQRDRFAMAP